MWDNVKMRKRNDFFKNGSWRFSWVGFALSINSFKLFGNRCKRNRYLEFCFIFKLRYLLEVVWLWIMEGGVNFFSDLFFMWVREVVISKIWCFELLFCVLIRNYFGVVCFRVIKFETFFKRYRDRFKFM